MRAACSLVALGLVLGLGLRAAAERFETRSLTAPGVILVRGGAFLMGSDDADIAAAVTLCRAQAEDASLCQPDLFADEQPRHLVYVSAFRIDRTEVAQGDYQRCVQQGLCPPPRVGALDPRLAEAGQPVVGVTAVEAENFCRTLGGRLPTEAEWERAARGSGARRFPWGQQWNSRVVNHGSAGNQSELLDGYEFAAPVGAFADGRSAYGLLNMAGNVWELTSDRYDPSYYAHSPAVDPGGAEQGEDAVIRGGSWRSPAVTQRVTQRASLKRIDSRADVGFRCAYNVP